MEDHIFILAERLEALTNKKPVIGFEKAKLEKVAKWFLKKAMRERNTFLTIKDLQWGGDKVERIVGKLESRYHQHMIYHRDNMGDLEYQLLKFPYANHDDLPDALQGLVQLLQVAPRKRKEKVQVEDEGFEYLYNMVKKKKAKKSPFVFGKSQKLTEMPYTETFR